MLRYLCLIAIIFSTLHVSNAERLSRECKALNGTCGVKDVACDVMFGSNWLSIGKCCSERPCCKLGECPEIVAYFSGSKYIFRCDGSNWTDAEDYCKTKGGHLASIESEEENNFLKRVATDILSTGQASPDHWWIGLTDSKTEGTFVWLSGQPLIYNDWYQGPPKQPDNKSGQGFTNLISDCGSLQPLYSFQWGDEPCSFNLCQSICEIQ